MAEGCREKAGADCPGLLLCLGHAPVTHARRHESDEIPRREFHGAHLQYSLPCSHLGQLPASRPWQVTYPKGRNTSPLNNKKLVHPDIISEHRTAALSCLCFFTRPGFSLKCPNGFHYSKSAIKKPVIPITCRSLARNFVRHCLFKNPAN